MAEDLDPDDFVYVAKATYDKKMKWGNIFKYATIGLGVALTITIGILLTKSAD